jgi:DNA-binding transcriptional LysR family regulator
MDELEVRELRYFVAVAQECSFSAAAERLGMTQPPLSRAIRALEAKLRVRLFQRSTRRVELTHAGTVLLEHAIPAIEAVDAAARFARRAGEACRTLRVATKPGLDVAPLRDIIDAYHHANPDLTRAEVMLCGFGQADGLVREGSADVAILRNPFDSHGLDFEPLLAEPRVALLRASHPLAGRRQLRRADLAGEPKPRPPAIDARTALYAAGLDAESLAMSTPQERPTLASPEGPVASDIAELLELIALGRAVAFAPASFAERHAHPEVVSRPVVDLSPSTMFVAWRESSTSRDVAALVRAACEIAVRRPNLLSAPA